MGKFFLGMIGILAVIFVMAYITPMLAKKVDNKRSKPARVDDKYNFQKDNLKDIYDINNDKEINDKEVNDNGKSE